MLILFPVWIAWVVLAHRYWGQQFATSFVIDACCIGHLFTWTIGAYVAECLCRHRDARPLIGWSAFALFLYWTMVGSFSTAGFMGAGIATAWVLYVLVARETHSQKTFPGCGRLGWWGARSYSLYLWHAPVIRVFVVLASVQARWIEDSYYYAFGLAVVAAVAALYVSRLAYWLVERYFIGARPRGSIPNDAGTGVRAQGVGPEPHQDRGHAPVAERFSVSPPPPMMSTPSSGQLPGI
jgi:peptidoglycan/LPS O-acetylase OafA/YrhL